MKVLSWDIGITNLAFCFLEKIDNKFKIIKWGKIDLVNNRLTCDRTARTGTLCGHIAKYKVLDIKNNNHYVCKKHMFEYLPELLDTDNALLCSGTIGKNKKQCNNKCIKSTYDNIGWCDKHLKLSKSYLSKYKTKKIPPQECSKLPIQSIALNMYQELDKEKDFLTAEYVLIENQPALTNPHMKTIACILYSYFILRGITDKNITKSNIVNIVSVAATQKLNINKTITDNILTETKQNTENNIKQTERLIYNITKELGIIYCKQLINQEDLKILNTHDKIDDMCDAFLQGFQYLFDNIPEEYVDKLKIIPQDLLDKINKKIKHKT